MTIHNPTEPHGSRILTLDELKRRYTLNTVRAACRTHGVHAGQPYADVAEPTRLAIQQQCVELEPALPHSDAEPQPNLDIARLFLQLVTGDASPLVRLRFVHDRDRDAPSVEQAGTIEMLWPDVGFAPSANVGTFFLPSCFGFDGDGFAHDKDATRFCCHFADFDKAIPTKWHRKPDILVHTSVKDGQQRGAAYWLIEPLPADQADTWKRNQARLLAYYGDDTSVKNPSRLMRLPGSLHMKREPQLVTFTSDIDPDARALGLPSSADIVDELPAVAAPATVVGSNVRELDLPGNVIVARRRLSDLLKQGRVAVAGNGGNSTTYQIATELVRDLGLSPETTLRLMQEIWNEYCVPPWSADELTTIVGNAASYGQNEPGAYASRPAAETFAGANLSPAKETEAVKNVPDAPPFLMDYAGLMSLPDPEPLLRGYIAVGDHAELRGYLKSAKTFVALDVGLSIAAGVPALGHIETCKQGPVVYLAGEGFHVIKPRVKAWLRARDVSADTIAHTFFCKPAVPHSSQGVEECERYIAGIKAALKRNPVLVIIDTMSNALGGEDENSPASANLYSEMVKKMRHDLDCTALTVAHTGKDAERGTRGTSAFEANADAILQSSYDSASRVAEFSFINGRLGGDLTSNFYRLTNVPEVASKDYTPAVLIRTDKPSAKPVEADKWKSRRHEVIEVLRSRKHIGPDHFLPREMLAEALASSAFEGKEPRESDQEARGRWEKLRNDWIVILKNGAARGRFDDLWEDVPVPGTTNNQRRWFLPPELARSEDENREEA